MSEEWLPVREFPEHYEVSSTGQIRRTKSYHRLSGKPRVPRLLHVYYAFWLSIDNKIKARYSHRMVADAFLGPIPEGMQVNHKNGDKLDNRVENLEIVTNSQNRIHSYRVLGIKPNRATGSTNTNSKLTWPIVDAIKAEYATGETSHSRLAAKYGVCRATIMRMLLKRAWRDEDRPSALS